MKTQKMTHYKTDRLELHLMDCMELMRGYPDKHFELAIVDPPYGIDVANNTTGTVIRNKSDKDILQVKQWDKATPNVDYFTELKRVSKEQIIWGGNYFLNYLGYCKAPIIWDKLNGGSMYADGEMAWTSKGLPKTSRFGGISGAEHSRTQSVESKSFIQPRNLALCMIGFSPTTQKRVIRFWTLISAACHTQSPRITLGCT